MFDATQATVGHRKTQRPGTHALLAAGLSLIVAGAAFALSFSALADLARMTGVFPEPLPGLFPIVIDVFMIQASYSLVVAAAADDRGSRNYHWSVLAVTSTVSVALNCYHALAASGDVLPSAVSAAIASIPPLALLASTHGLIVHLSARRTEQERAPHAPNKATAAAPAIDMQSSPLSFPDDDDNVGNAAGATGAPAGEESTAHQSDSGPVESVSVPRMTDGDLQLARTVHVATRSTKPVHEIAIALAYARDGHTAASIENALNNSVHRTTISRWLTAARVSGSDVSGPSASEAPTPHVLT